MKNNIKNKWEINSLNQAEYKNLFDFIHEFSAKHKINLILFLNGNLGAGKTTFVQFFINYLNSNNQNLIINSPTFGKIHEYKIQNKNFYHLDLYRELPSPEELEEVFLDPQANYICVEWAEKLNQTEYIYLKQALNHRIVNLNLEIISENQRLIITDFPKLD